MKLNTRKANQARFEKAKAAILAAAMNPVTKDGDTFVSAQVVADFGGRATRKVIYGRNGLRRGVTMKDNKRKSDNGLGMLMISRKVPVTQVKNYVKTQGRHALLGKHMNKVGAEINSVLQFIDAQI